MDPGGPCRQWMVRRTDHPHSHHGAGHMSPKSGRYYTRSVMNILRSIRLRNVKDAQGLVSDVLLTSGEPLVRLEAFRTLLNLREFSGPKDGVVPPRELLAEEQRGALKPEFKQVYEQKYSLLPGTLEWYVRYDAHAFSAFLETLGEDPSEAADILGRVPLSESTLEYLRDNLRSDTKRLQAATILVMRGGDRICNARKRASQSARKLENRPSVRLRGGAIIVAYTKGMG